MAFYFWKTRGANSEGVKVEFNTTDNVYEVTAFKTGSGTQYPIIFSADGATDQIRLNVDGTTTVPELGVVRYDQPQTLTEDEQQQVRENLDIS